MTGSKGDVSITVVAVGPGDPRLLTVLGRETLQKAQVVVGFKSVLEVIKPWLSHAEVHSMSYQDQEAVLDYTTEQARQGRRCVVCCWGDLNVSASELLERVRRRVDRVELIPGVSSVQAACARAGISLEESLFITLHQRKRPPAGPLWEKESWGDLDELVHYLHEGRRHIILFPRPWDLMPPAIARSLLEAGIPAQRSVTVYERLTLEGEQEWHGTLAECSSLSRDFSDLSIMVFPHP